MGLRATGFSKRFALWFISRPFVAGHPWRLVGMYLLSCTILGSVMTGAATSIISIAIAEPMLEAMGYKRGDKFAATFMMGIAWAATVALITTPFGHAGNILIIDWIKRDFNYEISFIHFLVFGVPVGLFVLGVLMLVYRYIIKPDTGRIKELSGGYIAQEIRNLGPMKTSEKLAVGIFLAVIVWWLLPSFTGATEIGSYFNRMGMAVPALAGAVALCFIRFNNKPVMTFRSWMVEGVEWDSLMLIAAIGALSAVIENPNTGIAQFMDGIFRPIAQTVPFPVFLLISVFLVTLLTNAMSNLVSQTLAYTIMMPIAMAVGKADPGWNCHRRRVQYGLQPPLGHHLDGAGYGERLGANPLYVEVRPPPVHPDHNCVQPDRLSLCAAGFPLEFNRAGSCCARQLSYSRRPSERLHNIKILS